MSTPVILDGRTLSKAFKEEIALEVSALRKSHSATPHLVAILVGNDGASETYVGSKIKACEEVGIISTMIRFDSDVTEKTLLAEIERVNNDSTVHGLIVQLPLPDHISSEKVNSTIVASKDVDGFHPENTGKMAAGLDCYVPATPYGILMLLKRYNVPTKGKHCVVLGRSHIVGQPISLLLAQNADPGNCTVTLCHSKTANISEHTKRADIIVAAIGIPEFLKGDMVKESVVVIDVGITRIKADTKSGYRLVGDVEYSSVAPKCSFITPVPGGVGPMTIVGLMHNTIKAFKKAKGIS